MPEIDVLPFRHDETEPARVRLQPSDNEVHFVRQSNAITANLHQVPGIHERSDVTFEGRTRIRFDAEEFHQLSDARRVVHPLAHEI